MIIFLYFLNFKMYLYITQSTTMFPHDFLVLPRSIWKLATFPFPARIIIAIFRSAVHSLADDHFNDRTRLAISVSRVACCFALNFIINIINFAGYLLAVPSSLTSCTIRLTLWVNLPTMFEPAETNKLPEFTHGFVKSTFVRQLTCFRWIM